MDDTYIRNHVVVAGTITRRFQYSHTLSGEKFYTTMVEVTRLSENSDCIPIMVSGRLMDVSTDHSGDLVFAEGQLCSFRRREGNARRLLLYLAAEEIGFLDGLPPGDARNQIFLEGHICKTPVYRQTPAGRKITDLMIAVDRPYRKSDYIPCICWERNALYAEKFETGFHVRLLGRVQSREYWKDNGDMVLTKNRVYEVSVTRIKKVVG